MISGNYTNFNMKDNDVVEIRLIKSVEECSYYSVYGKGKKHENIGIAIITDSEKKVDGEFDCFWTDTPASKGTEKGKYHLTTIKIKGINPAGYVLEFEQIQDVLIYPANKSNKITTYGNWIRI